MLDGRNEMGPAFDAAAGVVGAGITIVDRGGHLGALHGARYGAAYCRDYAGWWGEDRVASQGSWGCCMNKRI